MRIGPRMHGRWSLLSIECYLNVGVPSFLINRACPDVLNFSGWKDGIRFSHQRIRCRVEFEGLSWRYSLRSYPECTTLPHFCHHAEHPDSQSHFLIPRAFLTSSVPSGVHDETLDDPELQVLPDRPHVMWIHVLHVRVACPRESRFVGSRTTEVGSRFFTHRR